MTDSIKPIQAASIITNEGASFVINMVPYDCSSSHPNFEAVVLAADEKRWEDIPNLLNIKKRVQQLCETAKEITVHDDHITFGGERIHGTIVDRILTMGNEGRDIQSMVLFLTNLYKNPEKTAIAELYDFLVKAKLPITEDGHFLAYKRVNANYTSCYDNKTDNSIGSQPTLDRTSCDTNRHNTCSRGLHFCSYSYLSSFSGARTLIVKINPADVVSIPSDYDNAKGRAWTYYVEGEVDQNRDALSETKSVVKSSNEVPTAELYDNASVEVLAYDAGYRHKRYKEALVPNPHTVESTDWTVWEENAALGIEHAKKRVARLYKAPKKQK
jgi:hypothetical protein